MNTPDRNAPKSAEATLRLIASLPAPDGLEDRVMAGLKSAPRSARVLHWPSMLQPAGGWMRGAAAAAIVFVVAGGGWGVYKRVQPTQPARVLVMPPRTGATAGFSNAGAMRTPQTINGPVLAKPATTQTAPAAKPPMHAVTLPVRRAKVVVVDKPQPQPTVSTNK